MKNYLKWDVIVFLVIGTDDDGQAVGASLYIYQLRCGGEIRNGKMLLLK